MVLLGAYGALEVLLDEWKGLHPYTTWSTVTPLHAQEILAEYPDAMPKTIGVTRAYATRHGAGPFPTWCKQMSSKMVDRSNPRNDWQGAVRFGPLDLVLMEYAARISKVDGIVVNCLDQLPAQPRMVAAYAGLDRLKIPHSLREQQQLTELLEAVVPIKSSTSADGIVESLSQIAPVVGIGRGATHLDREWKNVFTEPVVA
jgi:adenylosuccinate synthase